MLQKSSHFKPDQISLVEMLLIFKSTYIFEKLLIQKQRKTSSFSLDLKQQKTTKFLSRPENCSQIGPLKNIYPK